VKPQACSAFVLKDTSTAANHTAEEYQVAMTIPFAFGVGGKVLPPGAYLITARRASPESLTLCNWEKGVQVQVKGWALKWYPEGEDTIVFHKFRMMYMLTDIHFAHSSINIHFPTVTGESWNLTGPGKIEISGKLDEMN